MVQEKLPPSTTASRALAITNGLVSANGVEPTASSESSERISTSLEHVRPKDAYPLPSATSLAVHASQQQAQQASSAVSATPADPSLPSTSSAPPFALLPGEGAFTECSRWL